MLTARSEEVDEIVGFNMGADDYVTKPFSPSELVARVKAHLSRYERLTGTREEEKDEIIIRNLIIDKSSRRVYRSGREVSMTSKEFNLLLLLASNPNRVFSKEDIFDRIWGMDSAGNMATVTVHIRKIREKIEIDPANPQYIETIWGVGYRFAV